MTVQIKLKVIPKFPSDIVGGPGIEIEKSGRTYTISIDSDNLFADLPVVTVPTGGDRLILDGTTKREITVENFRLAQGLGVLATDYGAVPDSSTTGVPAANTTAILAAFAASPYVNLGGRAFYVTSIAIPVLAKRLFNGTLVAGGTYGASTAVVNVSANTAGFTLDNVTVSVDVATYTTTNGIAVTDSPNATVKNSSLSGLFPVQITGTSDNWHVDNNTFASGTYGRAIYATSTTGSIATISIASPAVITKASHGLLAGAPVVFYTSGALPTGLTNGVTYYVIAAGLAANTFEVSAIVGGSAINTSGSQSGTQLYTPNGAISGIASGNTIYKSTSVNSQAIVLYGQSDIIVTKNIILGSSHFGISTSFGARTSIATNVVKRTLREAIHTDSSVDVSIVGNDLSFDSAHVDVGLSVSADNTAPAVNTVVNGNLIDSPYGTGIYFVGAVGCSAQGNKIRNANVADTTLSASIILDGSTTTKCTIGQNTIVDTIANNDYQVAEGNYTGGGAPTANYIAPQIGPAGLLGRILSVATTDTAIRASSSPSSVDTVNGFWFGASAFSKRDTGGTSVELFDYDNVLVGSLGGSATPLINWGQTTHRWSSRSYGIVFASLDSSGFALNGSTSGTSTIKAPAAAGSGVFTLPASATDTLVGKASTDTLTNKTYNTAGTGNAFTVNGVSLDTAWTTYTPTVTSGSGSFTSVSATGAYKQIGKSILVRIRVGITTNGTAAGRVEATLPVAVGGGTNEQALVGVNPGTPVVLTTFIGPAISTTKVLLFTAAGTYPGADGAALTANGSYEVP